MTAVVAASLAAAYLGFGVMFVVLVVRLNIPEDPGPESLVLAILIWPAMIATIALWGFFMGLLALVRLLGGEW